MAGSTVTPLDLLRAPGPGDPVSPATGMCLFRLLLFGHTAALTSGQSGGCLGTQRFSSVVPPHVGARYSTQAYPIFAKTVRTLCVRSVS